MKIKTFSMGQNFTNCYIVYNESSKKAFCVDVCDRLSQTYFSFIESNSLNIEYLFLTHGHYDHTLDIAAFCRKFPDAKIIISKEDYLNILSQTAVFCSPSFFPEPDDFALEGKTFNFENSSLKVIATPGHSSGSVCYSLDDMLFCGDTVFAGSVGRTDLPTGSMMQLAASIQKLKQLGDCTLFPGHMEPTTLAAEKKYNPFFQ